MHMYVAINILLNQAMYIITYSYLYEYVAVFASFVL